MTFPLSRSDAVKPVSLSVWQQSLFALLWFLSSSDCLHWDCRALHKARLYLWCSLVNCPPGFHSHLEALKSLLDLVMGSPSCIQSTCLVRSVLCTATFYCWLSVSFEKIRSDNLSCFEEQLSQCQMFLDMRGWFGHRKTKKTVCIQRLCNQKLQILNTSWSIEILMSVSSILSAGSNLSSTPLWSSAYKQHKGICVQSSATKANWLLASKTRDSLIFRRVDDDQRWAGCFSAFVLWQSQRPVLWWAHALHMLLWYLIACF